MSERRLLSMLIKKRLVKCGSLCLFIPKMNVWEKVALYAHREACGKGTSLLTSAFRTTTCFQTLPSIFHVLCSV